MLRHRTRWVILGMAIMVAGVEATAQSKPAGQLVIAVDTAIAPSYLDPAEAPGTAVPFVFLYALLDAVIKALPGN